MGISQPSPLKSLESGALDYRRLNQAVAEAAFVRNETGQLRYGTGRPAPFKEAEFHPFKLYQLPQMYRDGTDPQTDWRRWRVRAGRVMEVNAIGTDGLNDNPDQETYPLQGVDSPALADYLVPANVAQFWFWVEIGQDESGARTAVVRYHTDPTQASYDGGEFAAQAWGPSDNPWSSFPKPDAQHVPIGWVDTSSQGGDLTAVVRQLLRTDVRRSSGMEGQVIAQLRFLGHPPFSSNMQGTWAGPSAQTSFIASFLSLEVTTEPDVDYDNIPSGPTNKSDPCRFCTTTFRNGSGSYIHTRTCARYDNAGPGGSNITNGGGLIYEKIKAYRVDTGESETYEFKINDDGSFETGANYHNTPPNLAAYHSSLECDNLANGSPDFPGEGWHAAGTEDSAVVDATTAHYHSDNTAIRDGTDGSDPLDVKHDIHDFYFEMTNGWSLQSIQDELDVMLARVNLNNPTQQYNIDGTTRPLNPLGEQIVVTRRGPYNDGLGTQYGIEYVFASTASPWNWSSAGPCVVACNITDSVNHYVLQGTYPLDEGIPYPWYPNAIGYLNNGLGDCFEMMKSQVLLPAASFTKTVYTYHAPTPDGSSWSATPAGWPTNPSNQRRGDLLDESEVEVIGAGKLVSIPRGNWITISQLT
jgi:hypothetical protein